MISYDEDNRVVRMSGGGGIGEAPVVYTFNARVVHLCSNCHGLIHAVVEYPDGFEPAAAFRRRSNGEIRLNSFAEAMAAYMVAPAYESSWLLDPVTGVRLLQFYDGVHFIEADNDRYGRCTYHHVLVGGASSDVFLFRQLAEKIKDVTGFVAYSHGFASLLDVLDKNPDMAEELAGAMLASLLEYVIKVPDEVWNAYSLYLISKTRFSISTMGYIERQIKGLYPHYFPAVVGPTVSQEEGEIVL
jgi:hypothetical protein